MALIKCLECSKEISDKAATCPNCGNPVNQVNKTMVQIDTAPQKRKKWRVRLLIFIPMFFFGSMLFVPSLFWGGGGIATFWFLIGLIGFIGMIISAIGSWLSEP